MPRIICATCGYSMTRVKSACPNCGAAITSSVSASPTILSPLSAGGHGTVFTPGTTSTPGIDPTSGRSPLASTTSTPASPFPIMATLSKHASTLDGTIIDPPGTFDIPARLDWSHITLIFLFFPFGLLIVFAFFMQRDQPQFRTTVTRLRILQASGIMRDARIEGDHMGAGLSQGDTVSLQGKDRGGALIVQSGYNQTAHGDIIIHNRHNYTCLRLLAAFLIIIYALILLILILSLILRFLSQ